MNFFVSSTDCSRIEKKYPQIAQIFADYVAQLISSEPQNDLDREQYVGEA
jgi:hypothetical protein